MLLKIGVILILCSVNTWAIFGLGKNPLISDVSLLKANVAANADAIAKFNTNFYTKADIDAKFEANAKVNAAAIAGVNNKVESTNNEVRTTMGNNNRMMNISKGIDEKNLNILIESYKQTIKDQGTIYQAIITLLILQIFILLRMIFKNNSIRDKRLDEKDNRNDEMQMKLIEGLMKDEMEDNEK